MNDIKEYRELLLLINLFQKIKQISWSADQTSKRYPAPEALTKTEINQLKRVYLALGFDIESVYKEWKKIYDKSQDD